MPERENSRPTTEEWIQYFERNANEIYQANAAKVCLDVLLEDPSSLDRSQQRRLLTACDVGMKVNPKGCKEYRMFKEFKERIKASFP